MTDRPTWKPRILWVSNGPMAASGYGQQTALFVPRLVAGGYHTSIFAMYGLEGAPLKADGVLMLPRIANPFGNDIVTAYRDFTYSDVVLTLYDAHALDPNVYGALPWCAWNPIDCTPAHPNTIKALSAARWLWALSPHGQKQMLNGGLPADRIRYVPHGIDTNVFRPGDRSAARRALAPHTGAAWPDDAWFVVMNSANKGVPSRKGFYEAFRAVAVMQQRHPDVYLYCHTEIQGIYQGEHLPTVVELTGLDKNRVIFPSQAHFVSGQLSPAYLAQCYQAGDVYLSASHGEGFGIPIIEAQACGLPAVLADNSAQHDLLFAGWHTPCVTYMPVAGMTWERPLVDAMVGNLESAYRARGDNLLRAKARAGAEAYSIDRVWADRMAPALEAIAAELVAERAKRATFVIPRPARDERPDVSVIMPVYRIGTYPHARRAVDSALDEPGIRVQVVMIDDGSDDDTYQTIQAWAAADPRIVALRCDAKSREPFDPYDLPHNMAMDAATGRYVVLGTSRSWYEGGALADMVAALDGNPGVGFVYGWTQYHGDEDKLHQPGAFDAEAFRAAFPSLQAYLYRREAWARGAKYRSLKGRLYPADWDFVNQLIFKLGYRGLVLPRVTYHHEYDATHSLTAQAAADPDVNALWAREWAAPQPCADGAHEWASVGLYVDGTLRVPCRRGTCPAELRQTSDGKATVYPSGFEMVAGGQTLDIEDDPQGGVAKIVMREIRTTYGLDNLPLEAGDTVVDAGAQIGLVSIYLAKRYPGITIYAFEPVPDNYTRLVRNLDANGVTNVWPINKALTGDGRLLTLYGDIHTNSGGISAYVTPAPSSNGNGRYEAQSLRLVDFLAERGVETVKLLKIDTEGAEYEILSDNVLLRTVYLVGEFHDSATLRAAGRDPQALALRCAEALGAERVRLSICPIAD
jgi:FkbM family methyltransferase